MYVDVPVLAFDTVSQPFLQRSRGRGIVIRRAWNNHGAWRRTLGAFTILHEFALVTASSLIPAHVEQGDYNAEQQVVLNWAGGRTGQRAAPAHPALSYIIIRYKAEGPGVGVASKWHKSETTEGWERIGSVSGAALENRDSWTLSYPLVLL